MTYKELLQKELDDHKAGLNEDNESYRYQLTGYNFVNDDDKTPLSELILDADIESDDFSIGFEQGYMRGLEVAITLISKNNE